MSQLRKLLSKKKKQKQQQLQKKQRNQKKQNHNKKVVIDTDTDTDIDNKYDNNANIKTHKYFLPHARLNKGQRRYCHCIMKARISKPGQHYGFCRGIAKIDFAKAKHYLQHDKAKARQHYFKINKTNCVMNYDYNDYSLREVQSFASEKGIPLFEIDNKCTGLQGKCNTTGGTTDKKKYYSKDRLVQLLTTNYIKTHTKSHSYSNADANSKKTKKTKK